MAIVVLVMVAAMTAAVVLAAAAVRQQRSNGREMAILFCWQFVLLFVLPAFGHVLPICMGQNILVN